MTKAQLDGTGIEIIQLIVAKNKGILLSITVDGANCHDKKLVKETFDAIIFQRRSQDEGIQNIRMDKGYDFHGIRKLFKESGYTAHIKSPGYEKCSVKGLIRAYFHHHKIFVLINCSQSNNFG